MKQALIIGISGQDGSYLSRLLLNNNYNVTGITRSLETLNLTGLKYLNIDSQIVVKEIVDINKSVLITLLEETQPDEIYNLASQSSVGLSFTKAHETVSYNILSVLSWLEAIKEVNPKIRFYQASSSEMFGNIGKDKLPLKESLIFHPASPYGVSKAAAHWLTVNYREANQMFCSCGILFNHESPLRGENYVVKKIINSAIKIKLGIKKDAIKVGNTTIKRDWGYAPKYVEAMWLMLQFNKPDDFIVCSGNVMSLNELIQNIMKALGLEKDKHIISDSNLLRPVDLDEIYGDNTKAKNLLGWNYNLSNMDLIKQLIKDEYQFIEWELARAK